ncbi:MAG: bifunctional riboflavin kinase/FAD synthetase [Thermoguttaceae bacterium]|nr:bifunctional riboflavin kinase/FAD synthetase [Thermoguttaceae bacterium]MDW8078989.1 bifunctional riboflavin kinase/FAD synthetase [Thermoguttaceae bacterium]
MTTLERPEDLPSSVPGTVVTVGNFDGVHVGHARLIRRACELGRQLGLASVVFTFDPHPAAVLQPDKAPVPLTDRIRKVELLGRLGVDFVLVYPTDRQLLSLSWHAFLEDILWRKLRVRAVVEGPDFRFGHGREGHVGLLQSWAQVRQVHVEIVPSVEVDGRAVSSSEVRQLLRAGQVGEANKLLLEPYRVRGRVVEGARRGRTLGYPTANLVDIPMLLPAEGIYAGRAYVYERSGVYPAAISLGPNPTFSEHQLKFEAYLLDFAGDLYGQEVEIEFLERLREVRHFTSVNALLDQMARDVEAVRQIVEIREPVGR